MTTDGSTPFIRRLQGLKQALIVLARLEVIRETSAPSSNTRVAVREPEPESTRATAVFRIDLQGREGRSAAATFIFEAEVFVTAIESRV